MGQAKYLTNITRDQHGTALPHRGIAALRAMVAMLTTTACIPFFTDLDILSNLLSIATLFIFMPVAIAYLVRR
jgi:APA family basic amino acid/polyamine antiporter